MSEEIVEGSEIKIDLTYSDGSTVSMGEAQFIDQIELASDVVEATLSIEEGRQRQQYEMAKKFVSVKIDFRPALSWVNAADVTSKPAAKSAFKKAVHRAIMRQEQSLVNDVLHMLYKDNLPAYPRDPANPFNREPDELNKALELHHKKAPGIGVRSGRSVR